MAKNTNILMVGVGGQGIILSSSITCLAAMHDGHDVKKNEIHGMSQRGGSVFSHVRFGDKVHSPVIPKGEADIILSLESMELLRWADYAGEDACIIYLKNNIKPSFLESYPTDIEEKIGQRFNHPIAIDLSRLKRAVGDPRTLNVATLGILSCHLSISLEAWNHAIGELVPEGTFEINRKAFEAGRRMGRRPDTGAATPINQPSAAVA